MPSMAATLSGRRVVDDGVRRVAQEVLAVVLQIVEVRAARLVRLPGASHVNAFVADGLGSRVLGAVAAGSHGVAAVHAAGLDGHGATARPRAGHQ